MMAFIHNNHRVQPTNDLNQSGFVGIRQQARLVRHLFGECGKVSILLECLPSVLFAGTEGIVAQYEDRELLNHGSRVKALTVEQLCLGINLHTAAKVGIDFLTVWVIRICQR